MSLNEQYKKRLNPSIQKSNSSSNLESKCKSSKVNYSDR